MLWQAIDLVFNFSGMWHDIQTLTDDNANWWVKASAGADRGVRPGTPPGRGPGYERARNLVLNAFADHDEQWAGGLHRQVAERLVLLARPAPGEACLTIGGGDGVVAAGLCEAVGASGVVVSPPAHRGAPPGCEPPGCGAGLRRDRSRPGVIRRRSPG